MTRSHTQPAPPRFAANAACDHCALPVPPGLIDPGAERQFCCSACRTAHAVINSAGLSRYYTLLAAADNPQPARTTDRAYQDFDDPGFAELHCTNVAPGVSTIELYVEAIHCAACVWLLEKLPLAIDGVLEARVNFSRATLFIRFVPERAALSTIARFIDSLGYPVHPLRGGRLAEIRAREDRAQLMRIGVAGAIAGNVMLLAFALYAGMLSGIEATFENFFRAVSATLGILALTWPGAVFFKGAVAALRTRTLHMDVPIALGLAVGGLAGLVNTIRAQGEIYFDTLTILVFLLLVGRWIQARQQRRSADAVEMLYSLTPSSAQLVEGDMKRDVPIEALQPGDVVEVPAGGSVPIDGEVVGGSTTLDQSILTGEPMPIAVGPGDKVTAGATAISAPIRVRVEQTGEQTRIGRLMRLVEEAAERRPRFVAMADRIAGVFVAAVLALAALTLVGWLFVSPEAAVHNATTLLIVTCPCALGLATPLAIVAAIGRAARRGILVKGGDALEALAGTGTLVLDKTGTITEGAMKVVQWHGPDHLKPLVAAAEARCAHPIAAAFTNAFHHDDALDVDLLQTVGGGISARIDADTLLVGSPRFVESHALPIPDTLADHVRAAVAAAQTPVVVALNGQVLAVAAVADEPRPDAAATIESLRRLGWEPHILSGDHPDVVRAVGLAVGVPPNRCTGNATPESKLETVERLARSGPVVMIGDGVNDAGALSAATVGVAVHAGADVAMNVADVYIARPGLEPLAALFRGARRTRNVIRRNLAASLAYNLVCASLAVSGLIGPLLAAILMPASSLTVVVLSYRSRTFETH